MNNNSSFNFSVNRENKTISVKREFGAKLPLVWDAYTRSGILDQWWDPKPWKASTKSMDFRKGGKWIYAMLGPDGEEHWAVAKYNDIRHQQKYTGTDAFSDSEGNINKDLPQSTWDVTFTDNESHTLVEFLISNSDPEQLEATLQMGFKDGLSLAMQGLDELLPSLKNQTAY
jgi:uncharacterized protein YndB with AHSA1/START domain